MAIKVAMVGAGSIGFTRELMRDILGVPELADTTFSFTDISQKNLDMVAQLCRKTIAANKLPAKIIATKNQREALAGADYVISTIRQGGLEAFQTDIDIPLKYGVDQCVGDTLCAGGIMYGQRTIAALLDPKLQETFHPYNTLEDAGIRPAMELAPWQTYPPTHHQRHGAHGEDCGRSSWPLLS